MLDIHCFEPRIYYRKELVGGNICLPYKSCRYNNTISRSDFWRMQYNDLHSSYLRDTVNKNKENQVQRNVLAVDRFLGYYHGYKENVVVKVT